MISPAACALRTPAFILDAARLAAAAKAAGSNRNRGASRRGRWPEGYPNPADGGLAATVVIERRTCPCWCGERPDPG